MTQQAQRRGPSQWQESPSPESSHLASESITITTFDQRIPSDRSHSANQSETHLFNDKGILCLGGVSVLLCPVVVHLKLKPSLTSWILHKWQRIYKRAHFLCKEGKSELKIFWNYRSSVNVFTLLRFDTSTLFVLVLFSLRIFFTWGSVKIIFMIILTLGNKQKKQTKQKLNKETNQTKTKQRDKQQNKTKQKQTQFSPLA